nr:MAG TPA: hypothetical protein [Caudoviricetes sp.]
MFPSFFVLIFKKAVFIYRLYLIRHNQLTTTLH